MNRYYSFGSTMATRRLSECHAMRVNWLVAGAKASGRRGLVWEGLQMQKASCILSLACRAVWLGVLLVKLAHDIMLLAGGATNYPCCLKPTTTNS